MLVLSLVEGINPICSPTARRWRLAQDATEVLFVMAASLEPAMPDDYSDRHPRS